MLRALYDFEAPYEGTLTFREKDLFVLLPRSDADPNWVHVVDGRGTHGYAPSNYLAPADCDLVQELGHIDAALQRLRSGNERSAAKHRLVVDELLELRRLIDARLDRLAEQHLYELTSLVRLETRSTFQEAYRATVASLDFVQRHALAVPRGVERVLGVDVGRVTLDVRRAGADSRRLEQVVAVVMEKASDRETNVDVDVWNQLLDLVTLIDPVLSTEALERYDCALVRRLIERLQAETRWNKRRPILAILFRGLHLSPLFTDVALNSVLPEELVRDIQTVRRLDKVGRGQPSHQLRLWWSMRLLAVTLCSPSRLSISQQIALGRGLVDILVDLLVVEAESIATIKTDTKSSETEGDVSSASFYLLLALHRQFQRSCPDGDFTVLDTVAEAPHTTHTVLVEKLICLFNREADPLKGLSGDQRLLAGESSVSCLMMGLFGRERTARLFYTSDQEVVYDIILRRLADYAAGDHRRTAALKLLRAIGRTTQLGRYRSDELAACLRNICLESQRLGCSSDAMEHDRRLVLKLYHEFPQLIVRS